MGFHWLRKIFGFQFFRSVSLKRKIAISFNVSAFIILLLVTFEYANFIEIKKEIKYLENTDLIRSKSLQLRRREARFFLYGQPNAKEEAAMVRLHLDELNMLLNDISTDARSVRLNKLQVHVDEYAKTFSRIELLFTEALAEFNRIKPLLKAHSEFLPSIESFMSDHPKQSAELLKKTLSLPDNHKLVVVLGGMDSEVRSLRKTGEEILLLTGELDKGARENVEVFIKISQTAIMVLFPLFLVIGIGTLFFISNNVVKRLRALIKVVESTGRGNFTERVPSEMFRYDDEVGVLIKKLSEMDDHLSARDKELQKKNVELLQSKKLAAIGTLASGVAHEINNPLSNINISAQVLAKEAQMDCTGKIHDIVEDIVSQIARVKSLVGDLLDFARGREPKAMPVNIVELIKGSYRAVAADRDISDIRFNLDSEAEVIADIDSLQMERVFINLFNNAVDAMADNSMDCGKALNVSVSCSDNSVVIVVSDNGCGISHENIEQVFEPFYTTKGRGTGLGLSVVFSIISKHRGHISVESAQNKGSQFTIILPRG